jgi:hypothetical protein
MSIEEKIFAAGFIGLCFAAILILLLGAGIELSAGIGFGAALVAFILLLIA